MRKSKSTKQALLLSVMSLILCVSMLVGTTFAWFTDSVSTGKNTIAAGNLDVELEYLVDGNWEKVTENTNVFEENTLWEPGHTEVVYLKVSNLGTLALDYKLGVNIAYELTSINVYGEELKLSEYLQVGVIEDQETAFADRAAARDAVTASTPLTDGYAKAGTLYAKNDVPTDGKTEQYVALVVYMPEETDNHANYMTGYDAPQITLGINLMATQETYEEDSFNEKYDENSIYAGIPAAQVTKVSEPITVTSATNGNTYPLNVAYLFETTEDYASAQENAHAKWHADFVATFDKDVADGAFGLAGQYDTFSPDWLAFEVSGITVKANEPIRMLEQVGISMNYEELCLLVEKFQCGAYAVDAAEMAGKTLTVELRIFEVEEPSDANGNSWNVETGKYQTIGSYSYTFPHAAVNAPIKNAQPAPYVGSMYDEGSNVVSYKGLSLTGDAYISIDNNASVAIENVTADVNGSVIVMDDYQPAIYIMNSEFTIDDGEYLIDASAISGGVYQIFLVNVKVNGEYLNDTTAKQYLNNVNWFQALQSN